MVDLDYHLERARAERDQASRAAHPAVAKAHRQLAALHDLRIKQLDESCSGSQVEAR